VEESRGLQRLGLHGGHNLKKGLAGPVSVRALRLRPRPPSPPAPFASDFPPPPAGLRGACWGGR
jgi:hypothetical protein